MKVTKAARIAALAATVALAATACTSGNSGDGGDGGSKQTAGSGAYDPAGVWTYAAGEPQKPLQPANANESYGNWVAENLFDGLTGYDPASGKLINVVAQSVETKDSQHYTVKIADGWTFHDGTPVLAKSFVDAWNWSASVKNAQLNSSWFADIAGYADVHPDDEKAQPKADTMSGLKVVDDKTFTIALTAPVAYFTYKLGYTAFSPLPEGFFKDPKGYGEHPVGNGPYQFVSWEHNKKIELKTYAKYTGPFKPKNGGIVFKNYATTEASYQDLLSDNVDVLNQVPPTDLAKYKTDLGDRALESPYGAIQNIAVAYYSPKIKAIKDPQKFIQGISMGIDRKTITATVLNGTRTPATGWVARGVEGFQENACGDICTYDPAKAKQLVQESGGIQGNKITILYNADGGHKEWVDAVCNSIRQATGVDCTGDGKPDFKTALDARDGKKVDSFTRAGWVQDYPVNANFLHDLYGTTAAGNKEGYSNPEFDRLAAEADKAPSLDESVKLYQQAEKSLATKIPAIPLWYYVANAGYSNKVANVSFDSFGDPVWTEVEVKK
jgi:oligopeptide transport system substrate-binding protein